MDQNLERYLETLGRLSALCAQVESLKANLQNATDWVDGWLNASADKAGTIPDGLNDLSLSAWPSNTQAFIDLTGKLHKTAREAMNQWNGVPDKRGFVHPAQIIQQVREHRHGRA